MDVNLVPQTREKFTKLQGEAPPSQQKLFADCIDGLDESSWAWISYVQSGADFIKSQTEAGQAQQAMYQSFYRAADDQITQVPDPEAKLFMLTGQRALLNREIASFLLLKTSTDAVKWTIAMLDTKYEAILNQPYGSFDFRHLFYEILIMAGGKLATFAIADPSAEIAVSLLEGIKIIAESFPVISSDVKKSAKMENYMVEMTEALRLWSAMARRLTVTIDQLISVNSKIMNLMDSYQEPPCQT